MNVSMIDILIYEPNHELRMILEKSITSSIAVHALPLLIRVSTYDIEKILYYLDENSAPCIHIISTSDHQGMSGFQLAKYIRKYDARGFIIFISNDPMSINKVFEYKIEAVDFINTNNRLDFICQVNEDLNYIISNWRY